MAISKSVSGHFSVMYFVIVYKQNKPFMILYVDLLGIV